MDNFSNKLKDIQVEPQNTSWLKLENRLMRDSFKAKPRRDYKLIISSAAAIALLVVAGFLYTKSINNIEVLQGYAMVDISNNTSKVDGIYNISKLRNLHSAYTNHGLMPVDD